MKITFEEVLSKDEWLHNEMLHSIPLELMDKVSEDRCYDVKLLVNGQELEPILFNKIMGNLEEYIKKEAKSLLKDKLQEATNKINNLHRILEEATEKISYEFDIEGQNY